MKKICACGEKMHKEATACQKCAQRSGAFNGNWKGGVTTHKAGYVMRKVPSHPRAPSNNGYVFEHVLVMEKKLSRYLLPDETVHHKNGVRSDNRLSNLELWVRPQPTGIRATDAVKWAKEILARYEPLPDSKKR